MSVPAFPTLSGVTFPIIRTPEWDTDVQISVAGKRTAFARRAYPRYRYELVITFLRTAAANLEFQTLLAFYNSVNGRSGLFTYTDQDDNAVTAQGIGIGDGNTLAFQLVRNLQGNNPYSFVEPVFAPLSSQIFINGVLQSTPSNYSINNYGLVTFTSAPNAGASITWTGTYAFYCRFDEDINAFEKIVSNIYELKKLKFSTELF